MHNKCKILKNRFLDKKRLPKVAEKDYKMGYYGSISTILGPLYTWAGLRAGLNSSNFNQ